MVEPTRLIEEKIVGGFEIGEGAGASPFKEVEIVEEEEVYPPEEEYIPPYVPPAEVPLAPSRREEVTRSKYYSDHERILKELRKAGDKGMCMTDKELATITGIDIESVLEHRQILELDEAVKTVQTVENPVVCHVDRLARTLRKLREK